ncbi:MAG: ATP-grasp domain-containing protein [Flavobacterium sp.]|nr:ATP-grasp domain-containing protein [Flavobacterium sp.]
MKNNILITSAGRRVSLVRFFQNELKLIFPGAKVFSTDSNPDYAAACVISDGCFQVPKVSSSNYIDDLLAVALTNQIGLIIPTIDTELLVLAQNTDLFAHHGISILVSDFELVNTFHFKRLSHDFFEKQGIDTAKEFDKNNYTLPVYIKPIDGSRSVDNFIVHHHDDFTEKHFSNERLMFLEYLDHAKHTELTIDMYYSRDGHLKCAVPRERIEVREGEVNKAITKNPEFIASIWKKMEHIVGFRGCITMQVFVQNDNQTIYAIEINPRFGGGFPLSYIAGANYPKWIIEEYFAGKEIPVFHDWQKNMLMLRYDHEVIVPNFIH